MPDKQDSAHFSILNLSQEDKGSSAMKSTGPVGAHSHHGNGRDRTASVPFSSVETKVMYYVAYEKLPLPVIPDSAVSRFGTSI